jgi:hypothetical protein
MKTSGDTAEYTPSGHCFYFAISQIVSSLNIVDKVSNTLQAFPRVTIPLKCGAKSLHESLGPFPNVSQYSFGHFLYISLEAAC